MNLENFYIFVLSTKALLGLLVDGINLERPSYEIY